MKNLRLSILPPPAARFRFHASRFTLHASRPTLHASRFTLHASLRPLFRLSCALLSSVLLGLLAALTLVACAATPEVEVPLPDTPAPTQLAPLPTPVVLASPTPSPIPPVTPTPVISFNLNDLGGGYSIGPWGLTTTLYLDVTNRAPITGPETIMYVYDGDPQAGGELIVQERFPKIPPEAPDGRDGFVTKEVIWDVRGKAGEHKIVVYLCLADVQPSPATCRTGGGRPSRGWCGISTY